MIVGNAAEVRSALSSRGYTRDQLPSERTLRDILNRLNYQLKRIQKGKPLKKTENTTPIFENLAAARDEAKPEPTAGNKLVPFGVLVLLSSVTGPV